MPDRAQAARVAEVTGLSFTDLQWLARIERELMGKASRLRALAQALPYGRRRHHLFAAAVACAAAADELRECPL